MSQVHALHAVLARKSAILLLAATLIAGCGGSDDKPATTQTAEQPASNPYYHRVANDMRDIGALAAGECENEQAIRRAMGRLDRDAHHLPFDDVKVQLIVRRMLRQTRDALSTCP